MIFTLTLLILMHGGQNVIWVSPVEFKSLDECRAVGELVIQSPINPASGYRCEAAGNDA